MTGRDHGKIAAAESALTVEETTSPEQTRAFAKSLAAAHPECPAIYLEGDLGAGKTVFTKGLASFYGVDESDVVSPTFALVNRYDGGRRTLYHIDLYRIENDRELTELGIEEMEEDGALVVVEWAEKLGRSARADAVRVKFEIAGETRRRITVSASPASPSARARR